MEASSREIAVWFLVNPLYMTDKTKRRSTHPHREFFLTQRTIAQSIRHLRKFITRCHLYQRSRVADELRLSFRQIEDVLVGFLREQPFSTSDRIYVETTFPSGSSAI